MEYAPRGTRSISLSHPLARYGGVGLDEYVREQQPPLLVAQIETATTEDPLDEIVAAGPDVVFIGTTDLSVDLGLDREQVRRRITEIAAAADRGNVALGGFGLERQDVRYRVDSSDLALLRGALADGR
jgi:4-hydroxy-2-oxoheptanedioate aldolase